MIDQDAERQLAVSVRYDPSTGSLTFLERPRDHFKTTAAWKTWNRLYCGRPAFNTPTTNGYLSGRFNGVTIRSHRVAFFIMTGRWPGEIDHINRCPYDNRWSNLREATRYENCQNRKTRTDNSTGQTGVYFHKRMQRWQAAITMNGKTYLLGTFMDRESATLARIDAERKLAFGGAA